MIYAESSSSREMRKTSKKKNKQKMTKQNRKEQNFIRHKQSKSILWENRDMTTKDTLGPSWSSPSWTHLIQMKSIVCKVCCSRVCFLRREPLAIRKQVRSQRRLGTGSPVGAIMRLYCIRSINTMHWLALIIFLRCARAHIHSKALYLFYEDVPTSSLVLHPRC